MNYCVITLDLIKSRKLKDRGGVQEELKDILKIINTKFAQMIKVPFAFTLGDEVQGIANSLEDSYTLIREYQRLLAEHYMYAGVGYGEITTRVSKRSGEMDGPAFYQARASVDYLKKEYERIHGNTLEERFAPLVYYTFASKKTTIVVNNYLKMIELLKYKLTDKQKEVYWLLFETDTYREVADMLSQSKSAITQKVQSGNLEEIRAGEEGFIELLKMVENSYDNKGGMLNV